MIRKSFNQKDTIKNDLLEPKLSSKDKIVRALLYILCFSTTMFFFLKVVLL